MACRVAAVILSWNGREDTLACLRSVEGEGVDLIVVDNASADAERRGRRTRVPERKARPERPERGYAGGMNVGVRVALERGADAVLLLNNDVEVEHGGIAAMATVAEGAGAVCPLITFADDPRKFGTPAHIRSEARLQRPPSRLRRAGGEVYRDGSYRPSLRRRDAHSPPGTREGRRARRRPFRLSGRHRLVAARASRRTGDRRRAVRASTAQGLGGHGRRGLANCALLQRPEHLGGLRAARAARSPRHLASSTCRSLGLRSPGATRPREACSASRRSPRLARLPGPPLRRTHVAAGQSMVVPVRSFRRAARRRRRRSPLRVTDVSQLGQRWAVGILKLAYPLFENGDPLRKRRRAI